MPLHAGTVDLNHIVSHPVALTLSEGCKVRRKQDLLGLFSHKFDLVP